MTSMTSIMKDTVEIRAQHMKTLLKRKNYLLKAYDTYLPENIPLNVKSELNFIDNVIQEMDVDEQVFNIQTKAINIRNSREEEWCFQQMSHWVQRHPAALNGQLSKSGIYKFALHFFVENIVLNPSNANLNYSDLAQKVNHTGPSKADKERDTQLSNIETLLGFLLTMQQRQLEYIPEGINLDDGFVKYAINPINPTEFQQFGAPTELNPNNELAQSYKEYKKIRSRDKQLIKKYHQAGGEIDDN